MPSTYTVVGAGAIGGTLAHHLARVGHRIQVIDTDPDHIRAITEHGIVVRRDEQSRAVPVDSATTPDDPTGPKYVERVILAVKAQATSQALDWIEPRLSTGGFVVSLQNGLNEGAIADRVGAGRTVGAFVNLFADVVGPGQVRDGGQGALVIGETDGTASERTRRVVDDLQAWGPAQATTNVLGYLWSKLGFGTMLTATALVDAPMADLIDRHRNLMQALAAEVFAVAARLDITLEDFDGFDPVPYTRGDHSAKEAATDTLVAWLHTQTKDRSGIWRDLAVRRRPTEVPSHFEPVVEKARVVHIPTPLLSALLTHIHALEHGESMSESRLADLEDLL